MVSSMSLLLADRGVKAHGRAFGAKPLDVQYKFADAKVVLTLDADPFTTRAWPSGACPRFYEACWFPAKP